MLNSTSTALKTKMLKNKDFTCFQTLRCNIYLANNVSMINFMLSSVEDEKEFYNIVLWAKFSFFESLSC